MTSLAIAEGTGIEHKNVLELIRTHRAKLEGFGLIAFETRNSADLLDRSNRGRPARLLS